MRELQEKQRKMLKRHRRTQQKLAKGARDRLREEEAAKKARGEDYLNIESPDEAEIASTESDTEPPPKKSRYVLELYKRNENRTQSYKHSITFLFLANLRKR